MIPNTTQVPNSILRVLMKDLSETELKVLLYIVTCTLGWIEDLQTKRRKEKDWISYSQLKTVTGKQSAAISKALKGLEDKNLIEIFDKNGFRLKTVEQRRGKRLLYRLSTTSSESEQVNRPITSNLFGKRSSESEETKEIYTKVLSKDNTRVLKKPSCPLLNGSPLRTRWPRGHIECVEYITTFKFTNIAKQFKFLHQMLRAGIDFPNIDRIIARVEKKPYFQENGWDFATLAGEADRSANAKR